MLTIKIINAAGAVMAQIDDAESAQLLYEAAYAEGDAIVLESSEAGVFVAARLEDSMPEAVVYLADKCYTLPVPFGEKRSSYCPKSFCGERHFLMARTATATEIAARRDLAQNPYDHHQNEALFPHAIANVETRGEAVFAARNAINGNTANHGHGVWPYESWGIQRREDAAFTVQFGRTVQCDGVGITIRCDFPHDNWWHTVSVEFSDGSRETFSLQKTALPQHFAIPARKIAWARLCEMKKDETDESPFPALSALQIFGTEA